jgi:hypothetical protein
MVLRCGVSEMKRRYIVELAVDVEVEGDEHFPTKKQLRQYVEKSLEDLDWKSNLLVRARIRKVD